MFIRLVSTECSFASSPSLKVLQGETGINSDKLKTLNDEINMKVAEVWQLLGTQWSVYYPVMFSFHWRAAGHIGHTGAGGRGPAVNEEGGGSGEGEGEREDASCQHDAQGRWSCGKGS